MLLPASSTFSVSFVDFRLFHAAHNPSNKNITENTMTDIRPGTYRDISVRNNCVIYLSLLRLCDIYTYMVE